MAQNYQFSIAVHIMSTLGYERGAEVCSSVMAKSINANASFVRRILSKLTKAGLVDSSAGKGGACALAKRPTQISLLDIYQAVQAPKAFAIHNYPVQKACDISCHIKSSMERALEKTQKSFEESLQKITLSEVIADIKERK